MTNLPGITQIKVGEQWYYRGNCSPTWFFLASRADDSASGIAEKVPVSHYPLLDELAKQMPILDNRLARIKELGILLRTAIAALDEIGNAYGCTQGFDGASAYRIANQALMSIHYPTVECAFCGEPIKDCHCFKSKPKVSK